MGMLDIGKYWGVFQDKKKRIGLSTSKVQEQNLLQTAVHQRLGEESYSRTITYNTRPTLCCLPRRQWMVPSGQTVFKSA
jgi:hypothetical protein